MADDTITQEAPSEQPAAPSLQLSDLVTILQTLQVSSQRGAIRADEMTTVGGVYDRLFAFLEAQGVISRQPQASTPATEGASDNA
jgi:hypothetical protein